MATDPQSAHLERQTERAWYAPTTIACDQPGCLWFGKRPSAWTCDYHPVRKVGA